jgi:Zn-dependent peptidase ImmA (M78 family)
MVRQVRDTQHGFGERPHYEQRELDDMFERLAVDFLKAKYGKAEFPLQTEDLKTLIEEHVNILDQYADLSKYGPGVEGVTVFRPAKGKPDVAVANSLQSNENRQRMTLAHELGHVRLHDHLFAMRDRQISGLPPNHSPNGIYCKRDTMESAPVKDWLEWQASYAASALLVPATRLREVVGGIQQHLNIFGAVEATSEHGRTLIDAVVKKFQVSPSAARVRLSVKNYLGTPAATRSLFG